MEEKTNSQIEEIKLEGYQDKIKSNNIIAFSYQQPLYYFEAKKVRGEVQITATGGNLYERDLTGFKLIYSTKDFSILNNLQRIIEKYKISYHNGQIIDSTNLPSGYGETISVIYDSKEEIYKSSNQYPIISKKAVEEIYNVFHEDAKKNNLDFCKKKSNTKIYDDATKDFLEGRWIGNYLNDEFIVDFLGDNIKIFVNGDLKDDTTYIIIRGCVRKKRKKVEVPSSEYDFERFHALASLRKKNASTLIAYLTDANNIEIELNRKKY